MVSGCLGAPPRVIGWAMMRAVLPALALSIAGCAPDLEAIIQEIQDAPLLSTGSSSGPDTAAPTTAATEDTVGSASDGGNETQAAGSSENDAGDTGETGAASSTGDDDEVLLPEVVALDLPKKVTAPGPVPIAVQTKNTSAVRLRQDGVDVGELAGAGEGMFVGELAVKGADDNGTHHIEVIATLGEHEDSDEATYEVQVPESGTPAWAMPGPLGSRTNRVVLTPEGDALEAGFLVGAGVPRPSLRKRSGLNGSELWPEKTIVLSELEGHVADIAVAPNGGLWVAMNVKEASQKWRPHVLLLTPEGGLTGVDYPGELGYTVRAVAADDEGGCFAVGYAAVEGGDLDVARWRINAMHQSTIADTWGYEPVDKPPHSFWDAGMDVVIAGDIAWVAGLSSGWHDEIKETYTRGMIVPMNLHTGVAGPVIIVPASGSWKHSVLYGLALDLEGDPGVVVTGSGCQGFCGAGMQRIETSRYTFAGVRTWHQLEVPSEGAYGSDVVVDSQGRAIVAGAGKQGGALRGRAFAHTIGVAELEPLWELWFPVSKEDSEALGAARDKYDRIFVGGYITAGGSPQARLMQVGQ